MMTHEYRVYFFSETPITIAGVRGVTMEFSMYIERCSRAIYNYEMLSELLIKTNSQLTVMYRPTWRLVGVISKYQQLSDGYTEISLSKSQFNIEGKCEVWKKYIKD